MSAAANAPSGRPLIHQRCAIHTDREAAARCPECRTFYCRECVTEHQGRMMCARCFARLEQSASHKRSSPALWSTLSIAGLLLAWLIFYYLGMTLARVPSTFHGGTP